MDVGSVQLFLTGLTVGNTKPSLSLGNWCATGAQMQDMIAIYSTAVQGLTINNASSYNGIGEGSISIDADGFAVYTPPDGNVGARGFIADGASGYLFGADTDKWVLVTRESGGTWKGTCVFDLVDAMSGVLSMGTVSDAKRQSGDDFHRAICVYVNDDNCNIRMWITTDGQSSWSLATETVVSGKIQFIPSELSAPSGVSWVNAVSSSTALDLGSMDDGDLMGIWIRRRFPASGTVAASEQVVLNVEYS